ncbi:MAG TPA: hypothetical protein DD435_09920 [Cyanobacteria bacterium UBA8530]|nr:hypothetical protein [Cyanobacteria bacterium UBA8530]
MKKLAFAIIPLFSLQMLAGCGTSVQPMIHQETTSTVQSLSTASYSAFLQHDRRITNPNQPEDSEFLSLRIKVKIKKLLGTSTYFDDWYVTDSGDESWDFGSPLFLGKDGGLYLCKTSDAAPPYRYYRVGSYSAKDPANLPDGTPISYTLDSGFAMNYRFVSECGTKLVKYNLTMNQRPKETMNLPLIPVPD